MSSFALALRTDLDLLTNAIEADVDYARRGWPLFERSLSELEDEMKKAAARLLDGDPSAEAYLERLDRAVRTHPEHAKRQQRQAQAWDKEHASAQGVPFGGGNHVAFSKAVPGMGANRVPAYRVPAYPPIPGQRQSLRRS